MKKIIWIAGVFVSMAIFSQAQNVSKGKVITEVKGKGFYYESIMKDVSAVEERLSEERAFRSLHYGSIWHGFA